MLKRLTSKRPGNGGISPRVAYSACAVSSRASTSPIPRGSPSTVRRSLRPIESRTRAQRPGRAAAGSGGRRSRSAGARQPPRGRTSPRRSCTPVGRAHRRGWAAAGRRSGLPRPGRHRASTVGGGGLAPAVGVVQLGLDRVGVDHVDRPILASEGVGEASGERDVALLDLFVGLGTVHPGQVEHGVDAIQGCREPLRGRRTPAARCGPRRRRSGRAAGRRCATRGIRGHR